MGTGCLSLMSQHFVWAAEDHVCYWCCFRHLHPIAISMEDFFFHSMWAEHNPLPALRHFFYRSTNHPVPPTRCSVCYSMDQPLHRRILEMAFGHFWPELQLNAYLIHALGPNVPWPPHFVCPSKLRLHAFPAHPNQCCPWRADHHRYRTELHHSLLNNFLWFVSVGSSVHWPIFGFQI